MDVTTVLSALKVKICSVSARDTGDGRASIYMTIAVADRNELSAAMTKLSYISGVTDVVRTGGVENK